MLNGLCRCLKMFLIRAMVAGIGYSQVMVTLSQYLEANFEQSVRLFAGLMSINALTVTAMQIPISRWAEMSIVVLCASFFYRAGQREFIERSRVRA
jgi:hypothetical protein